MSDPAKKQFPQTVGIMGAGNGCGVTHFAVLLANYLAAVELEKTAVFEWNPRNDLEKLVKVYQRSSQNKVPVSIFNVDYFFHGSSEMLNTCIQSGYGTVVLDLGAAGEGRQTEFVQCQRKYFILALNEWKLHEVLAQKAFFQKGKGQWNFLMTFGSREARKEIQRRYGLNIVQIPYAPDALMIEQEMAGFLSGVWNRKR